ncbi:hypothetical protein ACFQ6U_21515 [Streptomyces sp. NPDC056465]|uniref:hypothetical protein n=1 Tax=Streptomyces sp. NPDC056465 TaxID=3345829 RepID=UPI0036CC672F
MRKHVIALLAAGGSGEDAQAVSASAPPIALTRSSDIRTVRQALLLGSPGPAGGPPLLGSPEMTRISERLRAEGRDGLADALLLYEGPRSAPATEAPAVPAGPPARTRGTAAPVPYRRSRTDP